MRNDSMDILGDELLPRAVRFQHIDDTANKLRS
jgi:hypothetical protein